MQETREAEEIHRENQINRQNKDQGHREKAKGSPGPKGNGKTQYEPLRRERKTRECRGKG